MTTAQTHREARALLWEARALVSEQEAEAIRLDPRFGFLERESRRENVLKRAQECREMAAELFAAEKAANDATEEVA